MYIHVYVYVYIYIYIYMYTHRLVPTPIHSDACNAIPWWTTGYSWIVVAIAVACFRMVIPYDIVM